MKHNTVTRPGLLKGDGGRPCTLLEIAGFSGTIKPFRIMLKKLFSPPHGH